MKPEMKRMNASELGDKSVFDATMGAVIIYDTCDFAAKAKAMLERVAHRMDEPTHWSFKPWRADMLKVPPAAEAALAEAAEAHLIVLAVCQVQSLLSWLVDWLERWATRRLVQEAALAVWDGGNAAPHLTRATAELLQFAERHGLSLIFGDNPPVGDKCSMLLSDLHEREVSLTPKLQHILEQPVRPHRNINE
jgi:hypothetical protein